MFSEQTAPIETSPITIKENLLTLLSMFSKHIAPIGIHDIPIDSDFHAHVDPGVRVWACSG